MWRLDGHCKDLDLDSEEEGGFRGSSSSPLPPQILALLSPYHSNVDQNCLLREAFPRTTLSKWYSTPHHALFITTAISHLLIALAVLEISQYGFFWVPVFILCPLPSGWKFFESTGVCVFLI